MTGDGHVPFRGSLGLTVSSAQLKVSHRELAAVGEIGVPINVGSWRVRRVIQDESCPWDYPVSGNVGIRARGC